MQAEEFRRIPVGQLVFSQTTAQKERRAHFDKTALTELAASVKEHGIAQPILVRPINDKSFEVCAGERRVLAAREAGLPDVPAMVRELSDEQLLELQLIENLQREGLHELAEAEGYEKLMTKHKLTAEDIIAKVGKSKSYVYGRLKLTALCKEARTAFYEAKITASTALDLARLPADGLQQKALKDITKPHGRDEPLSVRAAREHIQNNYMLRVSVAGFPTDDATLVPKAGSCAACPKRTGNAPDLFGDLKTTDLCTDLSCFKSKIAAFGDRVVAGAKVSGQRVLTGAAVKKARPYEHSRHMPDYVQLDEKSYDHGNKSYAEVLGKDYTPTLLQDPDTGAIIKIAPRKDLPKPKRAKSSGSGASSGTNHNSHAKEKAKRELDDAEDRAVVQRIYEKAPTTLNHTALLMICCDLASTADYPNVDALLKGTGITKDGNSYTDFDKVFKKLPPHQLARLAYALIALVRMEDGLKQAAADLKIDPKKVRADLIAAKAKPAPAKDAKAKTKPAAKAKAAPKKKGKKK